MAVIFLSIWSCNNNQTSRAVNRQTPVSPDFIYSDTISIEYRHNSIYLEGIVKDTLAVGIMFDTGAYGLIASNNMREKFEGCDSLTLQIGNQTHTYNKVKYIDSDTFKGIKRQTGKDGILLGWDFFKDKCVEISYNNQYLRVFDSLPCWDSYDRIKLSLNNNYLITPVRVNIQNKSFLLDLILDTGLNESLVTHQGATPGLDYSDSPKGGRGKMFNNHINRINSLIADTIRVGDTYMTNTHIGFLEKDIFKTGDGKGQLYNGLLGNGFLENFSVIIDFKNEYLYLKPISN